MPMEAIARSRIACATSSAPTTRCAPPGCAEQGLSAAQPLRPLATGDLREENPGQHPGQRASRLAGPPLPVMLAQGMQTRDAPEMHRVPACQAVPGAANVRACPILLEYRFHAERESRMNRPSVRSLFLAEPPWRC